MTDVQQMGSLLQKMTADASEGVKFTRNQVQAMIEIVIPRFVTGAPGMPKGMSCDIDRDADGNGWTIRVTRPA